MYVVKRTRNSETLHSYMMILVPRCKILTFYRSHRCDWWKTRSWNVVS